MPGVARFEVVKAVDQSARFVTLTGSTVLEDAVHAERILLMGASGASLTFTLPAASGSGARYRFVVSVVNTSGYVIKVAVAADTIDGTVYVVDVDGASDNVKGFTAASADDTLTLNATTKGGKAIGDWVEMIDIAEGQYVASGNLTGSGTIAEGWTATVS